jgi:hypothetical protein
MEENGDKLLSILPLRTSLIPKHVTMDSHTLMAVFREDMGEIRALRNTPNAATRKRKADALLEGETTPVEKTPFLTEEIKNALWAMIFQHEAETLPDEENDFRAYGTHGRSFLFGYTEKERTATGRRALLISTQAEERKTTPGEVH